jgi:hypothetical protein
VRRDERHARRADGFWIARAFKESQIVQINLGKATTSLRARAQLDPPDFTQMSEGSDGFDLVVPVSITDRSGNEVVHAEITTWVTPVG